MGFITHYTTLDTLLNYILQNNTFQLNLITQTNDPFENKERMNFVMGDASLEKLAANVLALANDIYPQKIKIGCFVGKEPNGNCDLIKLESIKNAPMWAHYGDDFKGVAIVFDKNSLIKTCENFVKSDWACSAGAVKYDGVLKEDPTFITDLNELKHLPNEEIEKKYFEKIKDFWFNKDPKWEYEDEFRIMVYSKVSGPIEIEISNSMKAIVFGENVSDFLIETLSPKLIDLGVKCLKISFDLSENKFICKFV